MRALAVFICSLVSLATSFSCFTCNEKGLISGAKQCRDRKTVCPAGVTTCSMTVYLTGGRTRVRKFCTAPSTPLQQYLTMFPGSSFCQNIDMMPSEPARVRRDLPPSPPDAESSSLLCVCSTPLCNKGYYKKVVESTMFRRVVQRNESQSLERKENAKLTKGKHEVIRGEKLFRPSSVRDHPDADLERQMAEAGF